MYHELPRSARESQYLQNYKRTSISAQPHLQSTYSPYTYSSPPPTSPASQTPRPLRPLILPSYSPHPTLSLLRPPSPQSHHASPLTGTSTLATSLSIHTAPRTFSKYLTSPLFWNLLGASRLMRRNSIDSLLRNSSKVQNVPGNLYISKKGNMGIFPFV